MRPRTFKVVLATAGATAVAVGFLLRPSEEQIGLMYFYDKQYLKAKEHFQEVYTQDGENLFNLIPLVKAEFELSENNKGINRVQEYIDQHPNSIKSKLFLADLLNQMNQWGSWLKISEKIDIKDPKFLSEKERVLRHFGRGKEHVEVLKELVDSKSSNEKEGFNLAYLLAREGKFNEALEAIQKIQVPLIEQTFETVELHLAILVSLKQWEKAIQFAEEVIRLRPDPDQAAALAQLFKNPKLALEFLSSIDKSLQKNENVIEVKAGLMQKAEREFFLYQNLLSLLASNTMPESLYDTLFSLAVSYDDVQVLSKITAPKTLELINQLYVLQAVIKYPEIARQIKLENRSLDQALQIALEISGQEPSWDTLNWLLLLDYSAVTQEEKAILARGFADAGYNGAAKNILLKVTNFQKNSQIVPLAIDLGLIEHVKNYLQPNSSSWLYVLAAEGDQKSLAKEIKNHALNNEQIEELYWTAFNQKQYSTAHFLSKTLTEMKLVPLYRKYQAVTLLALKKPNQALPILQEISKEGMDVEEELIQGFAESGRRHELKEALDHYLAKYPDSLKKQAKAVYLLADNDFKEDAADLLIAIAEKDTKEKVKWYRQIVDLEQGSLLVDKIAREELTDDPITDVYLDALVQAKEKEKYSDTIAYLIPIENRIGRLKNYGKQAEQVELPLVKESVYSRIFSIDPKDSDALYVLGLSAYQRGEIKKAYRLLEQIEKKDWQVWIALAEIKENKQFFKNAFDLLIAKSDKEPFEWSALAGVYVKLDRWSDADAIWCSLIEKHPDLNDIRADYANFLIDQEFYKRAWLLLACGESVNLDLARVRLYKELVYPCRAYRLIHQVLSSNPQKASVYHSLASVDFAFGKWRQSLGALLISEKLEPANDSYRQTYIEIEKEHLPFIAFDGEWRKTGSTLLEKFLRMYWRRGPIEFRLETDHVENNAYLDPDTGLVTKATANPFQGELDYVYDACSGDLWRSRFFFGSGRLGCGVLYHRLDPWGAIDFLAEYNRPNWDFDQTTIDRGARDMIGIARSQKLHPTFAYILGYSYNRYNIQGFSGAATTWSCNCLANLRLSKNWHPLFVSINYGLDAEYAITLRKKDHRFYPLPIVDREDHSVTLFLQKDFKNRCNFQIWGGGLYNRKGLNVIAPIYGGDIFVGQKCAWLLNLHYSHTMSTANTLELADSLMIKIERNF